MRNPGSSKKEVTWSPTCLPSRFKIRGKNGGPDHISLVEGDSKGPKGRKGKGMP